MAISEVALAHYRRQVARARRAADAVARLWSRVDRTRIADSWAGQLRSAVALVSVAQADAAADADDYLGATTGAEPEARLDPDAFAGIASDGRDLETLLYLPAITALTEIGKGAPVETAMTAGAVELDMIVRTQVADASRVADGVALTARPEVDGWIRVLVLPSCSRCIILAGRTYRWNDGFLRHPRCDCRHEPVADVDPDDPAINPAAAFESMSEAEQDQVFTKAGAQAIRDGADMARVVNARRGMYEAGGRKLTTEATTKRGTNRRVRLMPEEIYRIAGDDRDEAIRLLRVHGYLTRRARTAQPERARPATPTPPKQAPSVAVGDAALKSVPAGLGRGSSVKLTRAQVAALRDYESSYFVAINGQLRRNDVSDSMRRTVGHIDAVMAQSALPNDVRAWRGVTHSARMFGDRLDGNLAGFVWREDAYTSTTTSERVAKDFGPGAGEQPVLMRILAPAGTPAVRISGSNFNEQAEILLGRGRRFRVVVDRGVSPNGTRHIDVEVLDV